MTFWSRVVLAGLGSALLLVGALGFQYLGGLPPCPMCIWQRWVHVAAVVLALVAVALPGATARLAAVGGGLVMLGSAALGGFHAGVEQGWWQGPTTCSSGPVGGLSSDQLLDQIMTAPLVRCDEIVWSLLGLTMAGWNALLSLVLMFVWISAAMMPTGRRRIV